jgi:hypothetical protein
MMMLKCSRNCMCEVASFFAEWIAVTIFWETRIVSLSVSPFNLLTKRKLLFIVSIKFSNWEVTIMLAV